MQNKKLPLFDFDGTITKSDSMFLFLKHLSGKSYWKKIFSITPVLILHKLGLTSATEAKETLLSTFIKGKSKQELELVSSSFLSILTKNIRPKALAEIEKLKQENHTIYIVSASASLWIEKWCEHNQLPLICTELEIIDKQYTGKLQSKNCNRIEKVNRIKKRITLEDYDEIKVFGDSKGDLEMFGLTTPQNQFYKPFRF